jgi:hypothetical protein
MIRQPHKALAILLWVSIALCSLTLLYMLVATPNAVYYTSAGELDAKVREIRSSVDLKTLQSRAAFITQMHAYSMNYSLAIFRVAGGTLIFAELLSILALVQVNRLKKQAN